MIRGRDLGDQDRRDAGERSSADSRDNTCDEDEVQAVSGALQCPANESKDGGEEDSVDSTDSVCDPAANEAAENSAEIVLVVVVRYVSGSLDSIGQLTMLTIPPCVVVLLTVPSGRPMPTSRT